MIDACGEIRSSSEVLDFMKSLEAQDNINVVEPAPPSLMALPGAFLVGPTNHAPDDGAIAIDVNRDHDDDNNNMYAAAAAADVPTIVAHLAPDEDEIRAMYQEQLEAEVRMRLALVTNDATILVADEVTKEDVPIRCSLTKRATRWIMALFAFVVAGGALGGVVYWTLQDDDAEGGMGALQNEEQQETDPLVTELQSFIAPTDDDLLVFMDPESPQSQALAWLRDDPITLTPGRSTETVLERYVLAVIYYTTAGQDWKQFPLIDSHHCTWNKSLVWSGEVVYDGVLCADEEAGGMIESLHLGGNNLFGTLPWEVVLLTHLKSLNLDDNALRGTIPTRITELTKLERFWTWSNRLTGTVPAHFSPNMVDLDLSKNLFNGTLPESWGTEMPALQQIRVYENSLTGTLPTSLGLLSDLIFFNAFQNQMTGTVPTELGQLPTLEAMNIQMNSFSGSVNETLCTLPRISYMVADCDEVDCPCCTNCCFNNAMGQCEDMTGNGGGRGRL